MTKKQLQALVDEYLKTLDNEKAEELFQTPHDHALLELDAFLEWFGNRVEQAANGWRPIETAPKDGREVIVGVDIASVWITRGAFYVAPGERDTPDSVGWWSYKHSVTQQKLEGIYEPTHWLPMPETPSDRELQEVIEANR